MPVPAKYFLIFIVLFVLSCAQKKEMSIGEFDQLYKYIEQNKNTLTLENVTVYKRENEDQYEYYCNEYKVGYWFSIKSIWGYDLKLYEDGEKQSDEVLKRNFPEEYEIIKLEILQKINFTAEIFYNYDIRVIHAVKNHFGLRAIYFSARNNKTLLISTDSSTINKYLENKSVLIKKYSDLCILINQ